MALKYKLQEEAQFTFKKGYLLENSNKFSHNDSLLFPTKINHRMMEEVQL